MTLSETSIHERGTDFHVSDSVLIYFAWRSHYNSFLSTNQTYVNEGFFLFIENVSVTVTMFDNQLEEGTPVSKSFIFNKIIETDRELTQYLTL